MPFFSLQPEDLESPEYNEEEVEEKVFNTPQEERVSIS
jgi:hypothetical protein